MKQATNSQQAQLHQVASDVQYTKFLLNNAIAAAAAVLQRDYGWNVDDSAEFATKMLNQIQTNWDDMKTKRPK